MDWRQLSSFLDRIYGNSDDLVWIVSADGDNVHYVNEAIEPLFGVSRERLYADPGVYVSAIHRDDRSAYEAFRDRLAEVATEERRPSPMSHQFRVRSGNDRTRWLSERVFPITDDDGVVRYWGGITRDVTDQREQTETLRVQAEELEVLNQVVRHDIRNEANLGIGVLRSLRRTGVADEEKLDQLEEIFERIVDLTETARDMTDVITTLSDEPEPVSVRRSLRREVANASTLSNDATVRIDGEIPDVDVRAGDILGAVFRNLLKNAIQHNDKPSPKVTVSGSIENDHVLVHVADNGPGIPDEKKATIFESGETLAGSEGSGFGLSLVGALVEQYDGRIYVWDNEPDGSVFTISLPRADRQGAIGG